MEFWIRYKDIIADGEDGIEERRDGVDEYIHRKLIVWMIIKRLVDIGIQGLKIQCKKIKNR